MGTVRKYSKHRAWTFEEINRLERMCEKGLPQETIAQALGRTVASVKSKRIALDLPGMKDSLDRLTMTDISILCGVSKDSVNKTWVRRGLATRKYGGVRHTSEKFCLISCKTIRTCGMQQTVISIFPESKVVCR